MDNMLAGRLKVDELVRKDGVVTTWLGTNEDDIRCLIRVWPYDPDRVDTAVRALWSREERRLRRLASLSGAEDALLTLTDAGLDDSANAFVMALASTGYGFTPLAQKLGRDREGALAFANLKKPSERAQIWRALERLANGINLMHRQRILHRNIGAENVFTDPSVGPNSWRLGGFEWAIRFGSETPDPSHVPTQPFSSGIESPDGASFGADWYQFGTLLTRLFCEVESTAQLPAQQRHEVMVREVEAGSRSRLTSREKIFILRLLALQTEERLVSGEQLVDELHDLAHSLSSGVTEISSELPFVLVFNPQHLPLLDACKDAGFYPSEDKLEPFRSADAEHVARLRDFLRADLEEAQLHRLPGGDRAYICGNRLTLTVGQFVPKRTGDVPAAATWEYAFLIGPTDLPGSDIESQRDLRGLTILPVPLHGVSSIRRYQSWDMILPPLKRHGESRMTRDLALMHDFVRCTNQLDLLFTSARIFPYVVIERFSGADGLEHIVIAEGSRGFQLPSWSMDRGRLAGMLVDECSSGKEGCTLALLTTHSRLSIGYRLNPEEWWTIVPSRRDNEAIELMRRPVPGKTLPAPQEGFIRTYGLYGQFRLVERRQRAIDRLQDYRMLLRTLSNPACRDSGVANDHLPLPPTFESKRAIMEDVERVRPIYALQGPPGTGKTTFESQHLRRVFEAYPESQVLVTAQAHAAVDVLRDKVRDAFSDKVEKERPIAIRLGRRDDQLLDDDSIESVALNLMRESYGLLEAMPRRSLLQDRWRKLLQDALANDPTREGDSLKRSTQELLKSGASITYCTTSASDLAALAESTEYDHHYDLVIVEESGRVHAFDLALPLQAGHHWLLLGDHEQLPPFDIRKFEEGLKYLDDAVEALQRLDVASEMDRDWISRWKRHSSDTKADFIAYANHRLRYFRWLHKELGGADGKRATTLEPLGNGAGMFTTQFRMHPHICEVISRAFYKRKLSTDPNLLDADGNQRAELRHQLEINVQGGAATIRELPLVWIDMPWSATDSRFRETGGYANEREALAVMAFIRALRLNPASTNRYTIAVLTPYRQQVRILQPMLRDEPVPGFFDLVSSSGVRNRAERGRWVHTIDSFQGNEADIVVVSLVRNNTMTTARNAFGFLVDPERLNVTLSRAKKLLVVVGSRQFLWNQAQFAVEGEELWSARVVLETFKEFVNCGSATTIPFSLFVPHN